MSAATLLDAAVSTPLRWLDAGRARVLAVLRWLFIRGTWRPFGSQAA